MFLPFRSKILVFCAPDAVENSRQMFSEHSGKKCLFVVYNFGWQHCSRITTWFPKTSIDSSVWQQSFVGFWLINQLIRICRWTVQNFTQKKCSDVYVPNFSARPFAANHQPMFGSMYKEKKTGFARLREKRLQKTEQLIYCWNHRRPAFH